MNKILSPDEIFAAINWEMLKEQKMALLEVMDQMINDPREEKLEGILNLIDYIQDCACDYLGVPEEEVFNLTIDEEDE